MPEFALFAEGNCVAPDVLAFIAAAVDLQMRRDVAPAWGGDEPWACVALDSLAGIRKDQTRKVLTFKRSLSVAGALGFHTDDGGVEYAEALAPAVKPGEPLDGTTTSHEVIETFGDPTCDVYVRGPSGRRLARELADPVEADGYIIPVTLGPETREVMVSNFVLPAWFTGGTGPFDYLERLSAPETMTAGGYFEYLDGQGHPQQIFADNRGRLAWLTKMTNATSRVHARVRGSLRRVGQPVG